MPRAARNVNVRHPKTNAYHYFPAGAELPEWALDRITNPVVVDDGDAPSAPGEADAPDDGLDALTRDQLRQVAEERGIDVSNVHRKDDLIGALRGGDR